MFYPKGTADRGWYDLGVTPSLDKFFDGLPVLKKAVASLMLASWNQIGPWLRQIDGLRRAA